MGTVKNTPEAPPSVRTVVATVGVLIVVALLTVSSRFWSQQADKLPTGDSAWTINIFMEMKALDQGANLSIPPPWDTRFARMFAQSLSHTGLRQKRTKSDPDKRDIVLIAPKAGSYTAQANFSIHISSLERSEPKKLNLSEQNREQWLSASEGVAINTPATVKIVDRMTKTTASSAELIEKLFGYVSNNIRIKPRADSDSETALKKKRATALGSARTLVALLRTAHLPARIVAGVNLQAPVADQPYYWLEVYDDETWLPLNPAQGHLKQLPAYYIPLRKGDSELIKTENINITSTVWKIDTTHAPAALSASDDSNLADILDLNRLSPASRENLGLLLLLPLGVLATEIMRQIMGIRTYGTFTPTLIALAIVHVDWVAATIIFMLVTIIGIAIRSYLPNLKLQRTPRLAIVFTLVSVSMSLVVSGFLYFDPGMDGLVVLLPVVVLTMLVDRIYTVADQNGMRTAMIRLLWTVVSAFISLLVLFQTEWGLWLVSYPELHAITLAVIILIGLYKGPKLSSVYALSWLHEPEPAKTRKVKKVAQSGQSSESM